MNKRISTTSGRMSSQIGGVGAPIPAGVTGTLRRFWEFAKKTARSFSKNLKDPEGREEEFLRVVRRDAEKWD